MATVTFVYGGEGQQGIVLWNLSRDRRTTTTCTRQQSTSTRWRGRPSTLAGSDPVKVTTGEAVMVPAGIPHGIRNLSTDRCTYLAITSPGPYEKVLVDRD